MFYAGMVYELSIIFMIDAIVNKIIWLALVSFVLLAFATFLSIKAECKQIDKDREYEDKFTELKKQIEFRDDVLHDFTNAYNSLANEVEYIRLKIKERQ